MTYVVYFGGIYLTFQIFKLLVNGGIVVLVDF